jgi:hypothetical protein
MVGLGLEDAGLLLPEQALAVAASAPAAATPVILSQGLAPDRGRGIRTR